MKRRRVLLLSGLLGLILALGALLAYPRVSGEIARLRRPTPVSEPVQLRFVALDGRIVDLRDLRGNVVLLEFWATWCPTCIKELPRLKALHDKYQSRGLQVIGVSLDDPADEEKLFELLERENVRWPQYFPGDGHYRTSELAKRFGVTGIPAMFLLDEQGRIVDTRVHVAQLEPALRRLLSEPRGLGRP